MEEARGSEKIPGGRVRGGGLRTGKGMKEEREPWWAWFLERRLGAPREERS